MDSRYRIEKRCEEVQTNLEKLIGQNPDDDQAIDQPLACADAKV